MSFLSGRLRRVLFSVLFVGIFIPVARGQNARLELYEGGSMDVSLGLRSHLLSGAGVRGAMGGFIAPITPDPFVIFGNPAALTRIEGRRVILASSPTVSANLSTITDPSPQVQVQADKILQSFRRAGPVTYPKVTGEFGRTGSLLTGFALSLPVGEEEDTWFDGKIPKLIDVIGFGYYEPLVVHASMIYGGLRMRLRTIEDTPENEIILYSSIKSDIDLLLTSDSWNISAAKTLGDFSLGLGLQRTGGRLEAHGNLRTDGIMSKAGTEASFNDPNSPWDDDYFSSMSGSFDGSSWATRLGLIYDTGGEFIYGAMLRMQQEMTMNGSLDLDMHSFKALRLNAPEGQDQFDVNQIQDISELTRTTPKIFETSNTMKVSIPSELSIAATYYGKLKPTLTLTKYFGELAYQYDMSEDGAPFHYKRGIKPNWSAGLGLDLNFIQVGLGATQLVDVVAGYRDRNGNPIAPAKAFILPRLNIGFDTGLSDNLTLGVLITGLPEDALRLTLEYSL